MIAAHQLRSASGLLAAAAAELKDVAPHPTGPVWDLHVKVNSLAARREEAPHDNHPAHS